MEYSDDRPFPSCLPACLMIGSTGNRLLHAVAALDSLTGTCHVITTYLPDAAVWEPDFRTRRPR